MSHFENNEERIVMIPDTDFSEKEIVEHLKKLNDISLNFVQDKRQQFRDYYRLYNNQRKNRKKVGINDIYVMMNALLAVFFADELSVSFRPRSPVDVDAAEKWSMLAKFDYEEMGMNMQDYMKQWNRLFYGVSLRYIGGWNAKTDTPYIVQYSPLCWLPDPHGDGITNDYRWHGFEIESDKNSLKMRKEFFNLHALKGKSYNPEKSATENQIRLAQGLTPISGDAKYAKDIVQLKDWYFEYQGRRYIATTDHEVKTVVRFEWIKPVTDLEKKYSETVKFPIAVNHYSPEPMNPFGVSVPGLIEDKQRAKSVLANLRIGVEKARLYPMYLYDRQKVMNRRDLDFGFNKLIGIDGPVDDSIVRPMTRDLKQLGQTVNMEQSLDAQAEKETGASALQQGILAAQARTLGEVQQVQSNANLRFALGSNIDAWGDICAWDLWRRSYIANFPANEKKIISVTSAFGEGFLTIKKKDLLTQKDPKIRITSKMKMKADRNEERLAFSSVTPILLQDPTTPAVSKLFMKRHLLKLHNIPEDQINVMVPKTPDEIDAEQENELLSRNMAVEIEATDDHLSHLVIHDRLEKNPATIAHVQAHMQMYIQSGGNQVSAEAALMGQENISDVASQAQSQISAQAANQPQGRQNNVSNFSV